MRTWIMVQNKVWTGGLIWLLGLLSSFVSAQVCDPLGQTPLADFRLTYDPAANRYTAWYVPSDNNPHRLTSGQFTIVTNNGFTTPAGNGRDANLQITNINGSWADQVFDNEFIASVGQPILPTMNGVAVHQVGKAPAGDDVDPDGATGPLNSDSPVTPGVPVPLFSFPGSECSSLVRILVNGEAIQQEMMLVFGNNLNNQLSFTTSRQAGSPTSNHYCKNDPQSNISIILPDIQDNNLSLCATSTSYSNNYFTQVLSNWNPADLPAGTHVLPTDKQEWSGFTVSPANLQSNVSIDPTTGAYTITFPTVGGVTQPGSVTICNTLRDNCNTATDQACVIVSWLSSGQVSITNNSPVCLANGSAIATLTATDGFTSYAWSGPGLTTSTGSSVTANLTSPGIYSYTVVATSAESCTAVSTTSVTVTNGATITGVIPTNPTSCLGTDGSVTLSGLGSNQEYTIAYSRNNGAPTTTTLTANGTGQIILAGLSAGVYSITASVDGCTSDPISTTLSDPNSPSAPVVSPSTTICLGNSATLTVDGSVGASFSWTGQYLSQATGSSVVATPTVAGSYEYAVTQTVAGCTSPPATTTLTVSPAPTITASALSATACVGGTISLSATVSGGTPGYTYTWTGPNFTTSTQTNPFVINNATAANSGNYTVSVTDSQFCSATAVAPVTVTVVNCCSLEVEVLASQTIVCAGTSITLSAVATGNAGALSYQWSPALTPGNTASVTVSPTATTTYTVVVTDAGAADCSRTEFITIQVNPSPVASLNALSSTICEGESIQLTANVTTGTVPPYTYSWSGPGFGTTGTSNTVSIPNATTANNGLYTVIVTDQNSCTATAATPTAVVVTPRPTFTLTPSNPSSCSGTNGSITIAGLTSGQIYTIGYTHDGGGIVSSSQAASGGQIILNALPSGVYSVTVSQNGCASEPQSITLSDPTSPAAPTITVSPSSTICLGASVTLTAAGTNLTWSGTNLPQTPGNSISVTPATSGNFEYTVRQSVAGCVSLPAVVTIVVNPTPSIATLAATPACVGQVLSLSATAAGGTPAYSYNWRTPDGLNLSGNPLNRTNAQISMSGSYTLVLTDANGCTATQTISTTVGTVPTVQVQPQQACVGSSVTLTAGGDNSANYFWSGPNGFTAVGQSITLTNIEAAAAGSYTVVVTGGNGCTGAAQGMVIVNSGPVVKAGFVTTNVCTGSTIQLLGDVTTGTVPPYAFSWTGPNGFAASIQNPVISPAEVVNSGSYTLVVTDQNGCRATTTTPTAVTVADCCPPREASVSIVAHDPSCGGTNGSATATLQPASPTGAQVTYQWQNVATNTIVGTTATANNLPAGSYVVTITETVASCVQTFTATVSLSETLGPDMTVTSISGANCGATNGSVQLAVVGGNTPYTASWSGPSSGSIASSGSPILISNLGAGNYTFTVTGTGSSCLSVDHAIVPILPTSLSLNAEISQPVACGSPGTVVVSWNSVGGPYQLTVDGITTAVTGTSQTLSLGAGTHTIQIASGNPLCVSDSRVITINSIQAPPVIGWSIQAQPACADQMGAISFAGGQSAATIYTLTRLNAGLVGTTTGDSPQVYSVGAGLYTVTRTEPNNCVTTENFEIIAPEAISFNIKTLDGVCGLPGSLTVTNVSGGTPTYTVTYSGPLSGTGMVGAGINGLTPGTYTITVVDSRGCSASSTVTIGSGSSAPTVTATISSATACVGGSFALHASVDPVGNYTYTWSGPNGFVATGAMVTVNPATVNHGGTYTVVVTSAEGCSATGVTASAITVSPCQEPCNLNINVIATNAHCGQSDGQVTATVSGGSGTYTYRWSNGATTPMLSGVPSGTYSVTVIDGASTNCYSTTLIAVGSEAGPQIVLGNVTPASCLGATGTVTVTVSGGSGPYTYRWSNGSAASALTGVVAGVYSVTVTDGTGCADVLVVTIPSTAGDLTTSITNTSSACGLATGTAQAIVQGGSQPYQYRWSTGAMTSGVTGLVAGVYSVTVTDANGCQSVTSVSINDTSAPQLSFVKVDAKCPGGSTGAATVTVTGGVAPYTYVWSNGATTGNINGVSAGVYSVVVTDANGCKSSGQVTIGQPSAILAELSASTIACGNTTGNITLVSVIGGTPGYTYSWSNGATTPSLTGVAAGTYTLTVTDANGCQAIGVATLTLPSDCPACIRPVLTVSGPVCVPATNTYQINVAASAGAIVSTSAGTLSGTSILNIPLGTAVVVTATNACGVVSTTVVSPTSCPPLTPTCPAGVQLTVGQAICVDGSSYAVSVTATTGAQISVQGGTYANGVITGVVGSPVTVVATLPGCGTAVAVVASPAACTNACASPLVSLAGPVCEGNSYSVRYTAPANVTVVASAGVVANGIISGIPLGSAVSVTAVSGSCPAQVVSLAAPTHCNEPPLVPGHPVVTEPGKPVTVCLPITDPNAGDTHTSQLCAQPAHGTASNVVVDNQMHTVCFTYTPNPGYTGLDQVCLITCDQGGLCDTTYVPVTVPISPTVVTPQPPVVPVTPIVTVVNVPKTQCYPILDPNVGDVHSYTVCGGPAHGTASVSINNATHQLCVTYTPNAGYSGPDELCLNVCDQTGLCTQVIVPIVVIPQPGPSTEPQPPTVVPPVIVTPVDVPQTVCVQINDPNMTDIHTASICGQPSAGTLTVGAVNNQTHMVCVTYTPPAGYSGQPLGGCLQVCDQGGLCTQVPVTITVIPGPPTSCPTVSVISTNPTTCTANNGSVTLTGLTAGQSYTVCYTKNFEGPLCQTIAANQNGRIVLSSLGVGLYSNITVGRAGCVSNAVSATLSGGLPEPSATCSVTAVCQGQSITLTATGTNIQWYGPGLLATTGSPVTAIPNVTGIVTYTAIQSANGCVSPPATVTVVVKPTPTFSVTATNPTVCNSADGRMTLIGLTPGQSYTVCYTKDAGTPVCAERLANVNGLLSIAGLTAGAYTNITVNELGCLSAPASVTLSNPVLPDPVITVAPSRTICLGQVVSLTATGQAGATYTWKGLGLLGTTGSVVTVNQQATGTFSYTVTQTIPGCGSSYAVTTITVNPVPSAVLISKTDPNSCSNPNGAITLGGLLSSQTYTVCYRVNGVGSPVCLQLSSNAIGNITMNGLAAGVYSVTVSNGGCNSQPVSATLVGQTPAQPNITVSPSATVCIGQSVTLTAASTAEGIFTWGGPDLGGITGGTVIATPTTTGVMTYTVVQSVNGCTSIPAVIPVTVMAIPAPTVVTTTAPASCSGTDGSVTLGGLTANQSYTVCYSKNGEATQCAPFVAGVNGQLAVTGLTSGGYSLTVLSAGGCRNTVPVSASVNSSTACSVCTDAPLIVAQPMLICRDSTKTVAMQIMDADLSDSFTATACGVGMSNATVTVSVDNATRQLFITYKAAPGFQGIDQVCVTVTDKCGNSDQVYVPIQVIRCVCGCSGTPPVVVPQPIITKINTPQEVCVPIVDTPTDTHTATVCGGPQHGTVEVTVNNQTHMLCVKYTPNSGYVGTDKVCITICDQTNRCTVIEVPITVIDVPNPPALSVVPLVTNCSSTTSALMPILDANVDNTHSIVVVSQPLNGTITAVVADQINHRVLITYIPAPGFTGNDKAVVRLTDSDGLSSEDIEIPLSVTPGTCPACVTMELKVLLEGPYNSATQRMNTILNQRGLLPGQTPIGQFAVATPPGQPYNTAPWNYTGTESVTNYASDVVDWVLVSLRTDELSTTPVFRVAGLLHDDGRISFVNSCFSIPDGSYHVVIEHRNHMGVMSPTKVPVVNSRLIFDFTLQDSYKITDPPSFGEIAIDGKWMMYGGDGKKDVFSDNFDINFFDSSLWKDESGIFDQYKLGDFNLDADVNFSDSVLWKKNNGRYSKVPH